MRIANWFGFVVLSITVAIAGCKEGAATKSNGPADRPTKVADKPGEEDAEVSANLAKLSPEDRQLATAQRLCPVSSQPLGSMEVPPKVTMQGQPVFLCCPNCQKDALANPDKTLAKVKELKETGSSPKLP